METCIPSPARGSHSERRCGSADCLTHLHAISPVVITIVDHATRETLRPLSDATLAMALCLFGPAVSSADPAMAVFGRRTCSGPPSSLWWRDQRDDPTPVQCYLPAVCLWCRAPARSWLRLTSRAAVGWPVAGAERDQRAGWVRDSGCRTRERGHAGGLDSGCIIRGDREAKALPRRCQGAAKALPRRCLVP